MTPSKTRAQLAEEALGVADRKAAALEVKITKTKAALDALEKQLAAAKQRRDYAAQNPDLPDQESEVPVAKLAYDKDPEF